jgi:enoyl-CoA hydratase/carnithine racemase
MSKTIEITRAGRVLIARLSNPPHALMSDQMIAELDELVTRAESDDTVGVVVLTGTEPNVFLTHYDVSELLHSARKAPSISEKQATVVLRWVRRLVSLSWLRRPVAKSPLGGVLKLQRMHDVLLRMGRSGTIYIAAINGATAGGGLELCLACDFRYMAGDAELAQPEVLLGFPPGGGGTQRLSRLIGRAKALELMLSGRPVDAAEARALGLVTEVVPHDQLIDYVVTKAQVLATRFKPAVSVIKRAVLEGGSLPLEDGLEREQAGFLAMLGTEGAKNAMKAYVGYTKQHGAIPASVPATREQLLAGTFSPFHAGSSA